MRAIAARFIVLWGLVLAAPALAHELAPDELVRKITAEVLETIHQDPVLRTGDRGKALALAEAKVLPHIDFARMVQLAVGRSWRTASPDQREMLTREFRSLLVRTYSAAIRAYEGQTLLVEPLRMKPGDTDVQVSSKYLKPGAPPVPVNYAMWKTPEGWKVYDISVDGVSLVITYRSSFDEEIRRSGLDGLIAKLRQKNRQIATSAEDSRPER